MIGFTQIYVDDDGYPSEKETQWVASAFVLLFWVIYVGKVRHVSDTND